MTKTIYKGVEIRQYGTMIGEGVYPLAFTDDLSEMGKAKLHESIYEAKAYIDAYTKAMIIKDESVEKFGCLRVDRIPRFWPFGGGVIFVAELSDGTYVAGKPKDYQAWLDSRK